MTGRPNQHTGPTKRHRKTCHGVHCRGDKTFMSDGGHYCKPCTRTIKDMDDDYGHGLTKSARTAKRL